MLLLSIIVQIVIVFQKTKGERNVEIQFIKQYIDKQYLKLSVTSFLCWDSRDIQLLALSLDQNHKNFQNVYSENIKFYKTINHIYVLDLNCENSINILLLSLIAHNVTQNITRFHLVIYYRYENLYLKFANSISRFIDARDVYLVNLPYRETVKYLIDKANKGFNFREPNHWLIIQDQDLYSNKNPEQIFDNINVLIDTKVILAQKFEENFTLKYVYKIHKHTKIIFDKFASWNVKENFTRFEINPISWRRHNIRKEVIRFTLVVTDNSSYNHMDDYRQNEIDTPTKLNYMLANSLLDYMNATKNFIYYPTWYNVKSKDQNGTLIGSVLNGQIEISGPFFCKPERLSWMDCIAMTYPVEGFFIFRQPPLSYVKNIYILPFETKLWLTDLSFLFLSALFLYIVIIWEWKLLIENDENPEFDMIHATFSDSLLFTMGAVCQQGYATEPKGTPGKILILTIFITLIFLFTAYTAYTVVLFQATANDIKTLKDLYDSEIVLGLEDKIYIREIFPKYTEPLRKKIYQEKITPKGQAPHYYPLKDGIEKVRNEYFAFHIDQISGYKVIHDTFLESEKCGLQQINYLYETNPWIVAPKNVPFKEIFIIGYRKLMDSGIVRRELKKRISHKPECNSQGNNFRSAGILDLYSIYMLLIIGVLSSLVILLFEILINKLITYKINNR